MKYRCLAIAVAVCTLGVVQLSAQTVAGAVRSEGVPVVGATVRLLELDRTQRTSSSGQFTFDNVPAGSYRLFVGMPGYAPAIDTVSVGRGTTRASVELRASVVALGEIVVSASPGARLTSDSYQPAASKAQIEFMRSAGASFAEKIADLPGVTVRSDGSAASRPILRGLSDNEVLVLENGLRMGDIAAYDPAHATPIDALAVSQIDVVRGPATILYGPSTIGGVVNVITDIVPAVSDHRVSGSGALEANSVSDQVAAHVNSVVSVGGNALGISGGRRRSHDIRIPPGSYEAGGSGAVFRLDRMPQTFERSQEAGAGFAHDGAFGTVGIGGKHFEADYGVPGVPPNDDFVNVPPGTSRIDQRRNTLEARGRFELRSAAVRQLRMSASYNDYNQTESPTVQDSSGVANPPANHFHKRELNGVLQLQQRELGRLQGTIGLWTNLERLDIDGEMPLGPNSVTAGVAGYAYEEYVATARTRFQAALRYDYARIQTKPFAASTDSVFRTLDAVRRTSAMTASVGLLHRLSSHVAASFSAARSFRAPTVQELFANGIDAASGTYSIGTADLGPETGLGADATLRGEFERLTFELSPFVNYIHNDIYGYLRGDTIEAFPVRQFAATNARLVGLEAGVTVAPTPRTALLARADYVNAEDTRHNVPLPSTPPLRGLLRGTFQAGRYAALAEWRTSAAQRRLGEGDTPTRGSAVLNIGGSVQVVQGGGVSHISVQCDNVLNRAYRDHLSASKDFLPQPARGLRISYVLSY